MQFGGKWGGWYCVHEESLEDTFYWICYTVVGNSILYTTILIIPSIIHLDICFNEIEGELEVQ